MSVRSQQPSDIQQSAGGRRRGRRHPKGRQTDPAALAEIRALLGDRPRRRDLLIEHLHLIQDTYHCLAARHLAALAEEMRLPQAEVYEVASFYAHFDIVREGETPPPPLTVRVCDSLSCALAGAERLLADLPAALGSEVRVVRAPCMGRCDVAPAAEVGHRSVGHADIATVKAAVDAGDVHPAIPAYTGYDAYSADGGYRLLRACLDGAHTPEQ